MEILSEKDCFKKKLSYYFDQSIKMIEIYKWRVWGNGSQSTELALN